ncbi:hypothetical protein B0H14DRAFT_2633738 [Mycena olivaceomarginata]|nr:hypothetical protein B0H14DRAFT_2633738 [Mycena olivaceomarginata]
MARVQTFAHRTRTPQTRTPHTPLISATHALPYMRSGHRGGRNTFIGWYTEQMSEGGVKEVIFRDLSGELSPTVSLLVEQAKNRVHRQRFHTWSQAGHDMCAGYRWRLETSWHYAGVQFQSPMGPGWVQVGLVASHLNNTKIIDIREVNITRHFKYSLLVAAGLSCRYHQCRQVRTAGVPHDRKGGHLVCCNARKDRVWWPAGWKARELRVTLSEGPEDDTTARMESDLWGMTSGNNPDYFGGLEKLNSLDKLEVQGRSKSSRLGSCNPQQRFRRAPAFIRRYPRPTYIPRQHSLSPILKSCALRQETTAAEVLIVWTRLERLRMRNSGHVSGLDSNPAASSGAHRLHVNLVQMEIPTENTKELG